MKKAGIVIALIFMSIACSITKVQPASQASAPTKGKTTSQRSLNLSIILILLILSFAANATPALAAPCPA